MVVGEGEVDHLTDGDGFAEIRILKHHRAFDDRPGLGLRPGLVDDGGSKSAPLHPVFVRVKVPPLSSSGVVLLVRARSAAATM